MSAGFIIAFAIGLAPGALFGMWFVSKDGLHDDPRIHLIVSAFSAALDALANHVREDHPVLVRGRALIAAFNSEK